MEKEIDKDARCFDRPFHVVLNKIGVDFLIPRIYNSKIECDKRRYQQINGEHYIFLKSEDNFASIDPPAGSTTHSIAITYTPDMEADIYFQMYSNMYEDISDQLPDSDFPCKALSVQPTMPGTVTCQIIINPGTGTLIMSSTVKRNDLDEFMALIEYMKPFTDQFPKESDKEGYKANTFHPTFIIDDFEDENEDDENVNKYPELDIYSSEDNSKENKPFDGYNFKVDLNDKESLRSTINYLINKFDTCREGYDFVDMQGKSLECNWELGNSDVPFFLAAVEHPALHKKILTFIDLAIATEGAWQDEESPLGLHAAFAMAMKDEKYIPKYIELLKQVDMDHEVHQGVQICEITTKWGITDGTLQLVAARCYSVCGQHGHDDFNFLINDGVLSEIKEDRDLQAKFFHYFMTDIANAERQSRHLLEYYVIPVIQSAEIEYDDTKLNHMINIMNEDVIPELEDIAI